MISDELRRRARIVGYDPSGVPDINFVSHDGNLEVVRTKFAAVVSCHCIEHQPDLVRHFRQVSALLNSRGKYYLVVPDKRYCFDHFIDPSSLQAVLEAKGQIRHPLTKVIEHRAFTTHNDAFRHWHGDHMDAGFEKSIPARTEKAVQEFHAAQGGYVDVHRWQFTPESFEDIMSGLSKMGEVRLKLKEINQTPQFDMQFTAILEAS